MGFKDSRLGKIISTLTDGFKAFADSITRVDIEDVSISDAINQVNHDGNDASNVSKKDEKLIEDVLSNNVKEGQKTINSDDLVGPAVSSTSNSGKKGKKSKDEVDAKALNERLEDETIKYINNPANHVDLEAPDPKKLDKGGKERQRIR